MATDPVVKELGQLWRLSQYTWQQKQGRVLLLSSMLISITVMWCMASSVCSSSYQLCSLAIPVPLSLLFWYARKAVLITSSALSALHTCYLALLHGHAALFRLPFSMLCQRIASACNVHLT